MGGVSGIVSQLPQDIGPRGGSDVDIVGEGRTICRGAGKWILL